MSRPLRANDEGARRPIFRSCAVAMRFRFTCWTLFVFFVIIEYLCVYACVCCWTPIVYQLSCREILMRVKSPEKPLWAITTSDWHAHSSGVWINFVFWLSFFFLINLNSFFFDHSTHIWIYFNATNDFFLQFHIWFLLSICEFF